MRNRGQRQPVHGSDLARSRLVPDEVQAEVLGRWPSQALANPSLTERGWLSVACGPMSGTWRPAWSTPVPVLWVLNALDVLGDNAEAGVIEWVAEQSDDPGGVMARSHLWPRVAELLAVAQDRTGLTWATRSAAGRLCRLARGPGQRSLAQLAGASDRAVVLALELREGRAGAARDDPADASWLVGGSGPRVLSAWGVERALTLPELVVWATICRSRTELAHCVGDVLVSAVQMACSRGWAVNDQLLAKLSALLGWTFPWMREDGSCEVLVEALQLLGGRRERIDPSALAVGSLAANGSVPYEVASVAAGYGATIGVLDRRVLGELGALAGRRGERVANKSLRGHGRTSLSDALVHRPVRGWLAGVGEVVDVGAIERVCGHDVSRWRIAFELADGRLTSLELADCVDAACR